jgi:hypothetical protein
MGDGDRDTRHRQRSGSVAPSDTSTRFTRRDDDEPRHHDGNRHHGRRSSSKAPSHASTRVTRRDDDEPRHHDGNRHQSKRSSSKAPSIAPSETNTEVTVRGRRTQRKPDRENRGPPVTLRKYDNITDDTHSQSSVRRSGSRSSSTRSYEDDRAEEEAINAQALADRSRRNLVQVDDSVSSFDPRPRRSGSVRKGSSKRDPSMSGHGSDITITGPRRERVTPSEISSSTQSTTSSFRPGSVFSDSSRKNGAIVRYKNGVEVYRPPSEAPSGTGSQLRRMKAQSSIGRSESDYAPTEFTEDRVTSKIDKNGDYKLVFPESKVNFAFDDRSKSKAPGSSRHGGDHYNIQHNTHNTHNTHITKIYNINTPNESKPQDNISYVPLGSLRHLPPQDLTPLITRERRPSYYDYQ